MKTKNLFYAAIICLTAISVVSCKGGRSKNENADLFSAMGCGTSQSALDWSGIYTAVLPCADCEGMQTTIVLNSDNTFELRTKYLGKSAEEFIQQGEFVWNETGNIITLLGVDATVMPTQYLVGETGLFQLDMDGNRMPSDVEPRYILEKVTDIVGKYWQLIELRGNEVPEFEDKERQPHFILNIENNQVFGHGGCNRFSGTYIIESGNRIRFSPMAATQMFCFDNMEIESEFIQIFEIVDNYTVSDNILSLNRARMAPLARFVMVLE